MRNTASKRQTAIRSVTKNKITALALTLSLIIPLCLPYVHADDTIKISNADDFHEFVKNCKTDTWSQGKIFSLENDIDLSDTEFNPVPTFGGTFYGNGYTISGVNISKKGSYQGLFRYVQSSGKIESLNVNGNIAPDGTKKYVGGIVGENSGIIKGCVFTGSVSADANTGGIAGYVTESGKITECIFSGSVTGNSYTGGIAGQNYGIVEGCENKGSINTTDNEPEKTIQDVKIDVENIRSTENVDTCTDTGGIVGFSKGTVRNCINNGGVGFKSLGYNTGGICGRQSGYISNCTNNGTINGRKDIGGITGQAEPYVLLEYTQDALQQLDNVFDGIQSIIDDKSLTGDNAISDNLEKLNSRMGKLTDILNVVSDDVQEYADGVSDSVNELTDKLHKALDDSSEALDTLETGTDKLADGIDGFKKSGDYMKTIVDDMKKAADTADGAYDDIKDASSLLARASDNISSACSELNDCADSLKPGVRKLKKAAEDLSKALEKKENANKYFKDLWDSIGNLQDTLGKTGQSIEDIINTLKELKNRGYIKNQIDGVTENLKLLAEAYKGIAESLQLIRDGILILVDDIDIYSLSYAFDMLSYGFSDLAGAVRRLRAAGDTLKDALDELDNVPDNANDAITSLQDGLSSMQDGTNSLSDSISKLSQTAKELSQGKRVEMPSASKIFGNDFDTLFNNMKDMQSEFSSLNDTLKDKKNTLSGKLDDLNAEINTLSDVLSDAYNDHVKKEEADSIKDEVVEDISDKEVYGDTRGKIANSTNTGVVNGDVNSGGIVGSMAVEYDFDPEDDIKNKGDKSLKFTYKTKCVILRCKNEGSVNVKKNYGGGIAGRMDLGSVVSCESYGGVSNDDGSYTGGIAGLSDTVIRNSVVKCGVSGGDYTGGIAGKASSVSNCYALVNIPKSGEFTGAIAGDADKSELKNNYFINDTFGGIDDITYSGSAEETDIGRLVSFAKAGFGTDIMFTLIFRADDKEISRIQFKYKDKIPEEQIPNVPEKDGYYGKWSSYNFDEATYDAVIEAEYYRDISLLESNLKRDNGKPIVLLCGAFDDSAKITAAARNGNVPSELKRKSVTEGYDVKISGSYTENYTVRYLPSGDKKKTALYVLYDGKKPEKIKTSTFGSYLEFEVSDKDFAVFEGKKSHTALILTLSGTAVLLLAAVFILIRLKKKKTAAKDKE